LQNLVLAKPFPFKVVAVNSRVSHPELVSGSKKYNILSDPETSSG
jgi:hypothetical protein